MLIENGWIYGDDFEFHRGSLRIEGDRIAEIQVAHYGQEHDRSPSPSHNQGFSSDDDTVFDASDCYVIPGLIDCHIHGAAGRDFCDGLPGALTHIGRYLAAQGVTSYTPASLSLPENKLTVAFQEARSQAARPAADEAAVCGIYMEGPFFSREKKGAHSEEYIISVDNSLFQRLDEASGHLIRVACIAPEKDGALEFIRAHQNQLTISIAHTSADYETAVAAFKAGATSVTHLFNAMKPFGHREPGVPGAAFDCGATVELIADGVHLHPSVIRAAFRLYGPERIVLVSDAMAACGMPDGAYQLGQLDVEVRDGTARLRDGTIAGSATSLMESMRRSVRFGIRLQDAVRAATSNAARVIGQAGNIGALAPGLQADIVILDRQLQVVRVLLRGRWLKQETA